MEPSGGSMSLCYTSRLDRPIFRQKGQTGDE